MPTSDPAKRRVQNRDNQKRFRERQSRQLANLSDAFATQNDRLKAVESELQRVHRSHRRAVALISRLRRMNTKLSDHLETFSHASKSLQDENRELAILRISQCPTPAPTQTPLPSVPLIDPSQSCREPHVDTSADLSLLTDVSRITAIADKFDLYSLDSGSLICEVPDNDISQTGVSFNNIPQQHSLQESSPSVAGSPSVPLCSATSPQALGVNWLGETAFKVPGESRSDLNHTFASYDSQFTSQIDEAETAEADEETQALCLDVQSHENQDSMAAYDAQLEDPSLSCDLLFDISDNFSVDAMQSFTGVPFTSRISKHIVAARSLIRNQITGIRQSDLDYNAISSAVSWMLRQAWPTSVNCLKFMGVYQQLFNYELWRNFPCRATYYNIHPQYRPTPIQLIVPHAPAIDWLPWPQLREKAIELQASLDIDLLNQTALKNTIIERKAMVVPASQQDIEHITFRAWDVYLLEKNAGVPFSDSSLKHEPKSASACALLRAYDIRVADLTYFRLDKAFFDSFPMLWSPELASCCKTVPLRYSHLETLDYPSDLDPQSLTTLRMSVQHAYSFDDQENWTH